MSLYTRLKIWVEGEILSAADLNTEFNNDMLNGPPNHASQHAASAVDDIKAYYLSLSAGGTVAAAVTFSAAAPITLTSRLNEYKGSNIASATTTDIGAAGGNFVDVTGTATITALGTIQAGTERIVRFTSTPTLTHNGTSLILPGGANIICQANDIAMFRSLGAGNWVCTSYQRAVNPPYVQSATPAANAVPVADGTGDIALGWIPDVLTGKGSVSSISDGTNIIKTKIINIGDWNMDTNAGPVYVSHGLTLSNIRNVSVFVRRDDGTITLPLAHADAFTEIDGNFFVSASQVALYRRTGSSIFDTADFDSTSYNRGWITITYVE